MPFAVVLFATASSPSQKIQGFQAGMGHNVFSEEEISLTLYSKEYSVPLTLIDLPGLVNNPPDAKMATANIFQKYGSREGRDFLRVLVLFCQLRCFISTCTVATARLRWIYLMLREDVI